MINRIARVAVAKIGHAVLHVVIPVLQCHIALIGDGVILGAIVSLVNAGVQALRSLSGRIMCLNRQLGLDGFVQVRVRSPEILCPA